VRLVEQASRLFRMTPVQHLRLRPDRALPSVLEPDEEAGAGHDPIRLATLAALVKVPEIGRLRLLDVRGHGLGDGAAWILVVSPHLGGQTRLLVGGNAIGGESEQALRERFGERVDFRPRSFFAPTASDDDEIPF
jgi:hypothetical protein